MKLKETLYASVVLIASALTAVAQVDVQKRLAAANPGETVELPAGEYRGGIAVPKGVSLKGAGVGKTIIDAAGGPSGLVVEGGESTQISDLTIRNAQGTGVTVNHAKSATLARVRATGCSIGIQLDHADKGRIENCISDRNRFGIIVNGGSDNAIVNCTVADCSEMGISLAGVASAVAFNNCIVGSAVCLNIDQPTHLRVDHNLYFGMFVGQMKEQIGKRILTAWQYLTGLDAHSVQMPVAFKNSEGGDFVPATTLPWALARPVTAEWGTAEFAGVKAPTTDILGHPRTGRFDVGAVEADIKPPRSADGQFTVSSDEGLKSAGVFTKDGMLVSYLFQNLPLSKGTHSFWLPARDYLGQPIPTGDYEVRLAESDFRWKYINHIADTGEDADGPGTASFNPRFAAFAPGDVLVMAQGPSEDHTDVRGYDIATGKVRWYLHGCMQAQGVAIAKDGMVYVLRQQDQNKGESRLTRLDAATGKVVPWPNSNTGHVYPITSPTVHSMAALGDHLYVADAVTNKVFVLALADGRVEKTFEVAKPRFLASDQKTGLLWIASGSGLIALGADGKKVAESQVVPDPISVAARDGQLAVASSKTGKVHIFDANDPHALKPLREVGRGDGPFGEIATDRFMFQSTSTSGELDDDFARASLALGPKGELSVIDARRVSLFDSNRKNLWYTIGVFGNASMPSFSTHNRRLCDTDGTISFMLDETKGDWKPEAVWDHSQIGINASKETIGLLGDFEAGGKTFLVFVKRGGGEPQSPHLTVARLDGFKSVPVLLVSTEGGKVVMREDTNGDGRVTAEDTAKPLVNAEGKPLPPGGVFQRFNYLYPDGSIAIMAHPPHVWQQTGLSDKGVPQYEGKNYRPLSQKNWATDASPYDLKPGGHVAQWCGPVVTGLLSDGGYVAQVIMRNSGGTGLNNGAGTDLCGYAPDGRRRWVHQLAQYKGIAGMGTVDDITLTSVFYSVENLVVDADGLGLGGFCEAPQLRYLGYWIDHPNLRLFKMPDGHLHATIGSNVGGRHLWYRLDNQESLKRTKQPFRVAAERASELATLDWKVTTTVARPPQPQIKIPRLAQPLAIDGDLEKWRKAGIQPSIVIGPMGGHEGPGDCSGIIRMAYEGQNLYFQILQFDDVPTFHQRDNMYQQNAVELALNGTHPNGFQFIVYKNSEGQDIVHRHRFFADIPARKIRPEHASRLVRVLPDAEAVTERKALEGLYGTDLSKSKVILTEFKLPMDKETFADAEADVIQLGPGKSFWLGFFLDDNDEPYTDVQELTYWPATFGMFNPKEEGAMAICE